MYLHRRSSPALVVRSPTRQCVIASARWVSEMILASARVWETIAVLIYNYEVLVGKACGLWSAIHVGTCNRGQGKRCFSERRPSANHSGRLHDLSSLGVFREMVARDLDRWRLFGHRRLP